jgi:hypothetical protein
VVALAIDQLSLPQRKPQIVSLIGVGRQLGVHIALCSLFVTAPNQHRIELVNGIPETLVEGVSPS